MPCSQENDGTGVRSWVGLIVDGKIYSTTKADLTCKLHIERKKTLLL